MGGFVFVFSRQQVINGVVIYITLHHRQVAIENCGYCPLGFLIITTMLVTFNYYWISLRDLSSLRYCTNSHLKCFVIPLKTYKTLTVFAANCLELSHTPYMHHLHLDELPDGRRLSPAKSSNLVLHYLYLKHEN